VALDATDLAAAFRPLNQVVDIVDVIEIGTILIITEGLRAVRETRALYPTATILADVRIAEAGALISRLCFEAGASWVTCVAGASLTTIEQVVQVAAEHGGEVQVELGETYSSTVARAWRSAGVQHVIVHRSRDAEAAGTLTWGRDDLQRIAELAEMGFTVTVTGGVTVEDLDVFADSPVGVVIAGRAITAAADPRGAATQLRDAIEQVWR
jgi:3-dehydro-L-gulonate-6-phosphate decarboxylase